MSELLFYAWELVQIPGVRTLMAGTVVLGIFLGGGLAYNYRDVGRWIVVSLPLVFAIELARRALVLALEGVPPTIRPPLLATLFFVLYALGLAAGAMIVEYIRRPYIKEREQMKRKVKDQLSKMVFQPEPTDAL